MGGTIRCRGGAPTRHLQPQDHRLRSLHQRLEHRIATSLLPLIYARFLLSVLLSTPRSLVTPDPSNGKGSGLTWGLIRAYLSGRHSLCPTLSHVKTQKGGSQKRTLRKTGRTTRNLRPSGYSAFAHQRDQSLFTRILSFMALTTERVEIH